MGASQCDTNGHARLLRPQPQPHQRPMRAAIRPNDTGGALCPRQHRGRLLAALHILNLKHKFEIELKPPLLAFFSQRILGGLKIFPTFALPIIANNGIF